MIQAQPAVRFELTTGGLRNRCSTPELRWLTETGDIIPENHTNEQRSKPSYQSYVDWREQRSGIQLGGGTSAITSDKQLELSNTIDKLSNLL